MKSSEPKKVKLNDNRYLDCDDYRGFKVEVNGDLVKEEKITETNERDFFSKYVAARKPVKIIGPISGIPVEELLPDRVETTLKWQSPLKVERKHKGGFGSNKERCHMKLGELLERFRHEDGQYYMTTQYEDSSDEDEGEEEGEEEYEDGNDEEEGLDYEKNLDENKSVQEQERGVGEHADDSDLLLEFDLNNLHDDYDECDEFLVERDYDDKKVRVLQLFQPPLTNFGKRLPLAPKPLSMLVPQQVNLWMGYSSLLPDSAASSHPEVLHDIDSKYVPGGTSSGLHHDHSDNLYVLISGRKRFTLFSPNYARRLYTVGNIYKLYHTGVIDYENDASSPQWQHVRDDGALVSQATHWELSKEGRDGESLNQMSKLTDENEKKATTNQKAAHPPSFSTIPPLLLHLDEIEKEKRLYLEEFAEKYFPGFLDIPKLVVWLNPGESLYLPAGWFHEVSSFGSDTSNSPWSDNVHTALNYWFAPPNCSSYDNPYRDSYWKEDFELTKEALDFLNRDKVE